MCRLKLRDSDANHAHMIDGHFFLHPTHDTANKMQHFVLENLKQNMQQLMEDSNLRLGSVITKYTLILLIDENYNVK